MSIITDLTRMWLTRQVKPFTFKKEYDQTLKFEDLESLGLYVHLPFCKSICNFCPYCKVVYNKELCDKYVDALLKEIRMVGESQYADAENGTGEFAESQTARKKRVTSLYFGGGTPVLALDRLDEIIKTIKQYFEITEGIGLELHPDNVNVPTLRALQATGVTKISIGIQSFQEKYQNILGRKVMDADAMEAMAKALDEVHFETVSMDFIFALPGQTYEDLQKDIDLAFGHGANHVAIYPFIDFTFTVSKVKAMNKKDKRILLDKITKYLLDKGYTRSSIWTFSSDKDAKYSSMTRDNFLGFGCSATTLLKDQFKINTFSVEEYCKRVEEGKLPTSLTIRFTERQRMIYYLFWTAYSTRVDERDFERFFGKSLRRMYGFELWLAKALGFVTEKNGIYEMTLKGAFYYHYYENFYTLAYIDKMWGIMRREAFPERIEL